MDDYDVPPEIAAAPTAQEGDWALGADGLVIDRPRPPWLAVPPPKKRPFNWPAGGKSPSWFKRLAKCPKQHAERYRRHKPDPSGIEAVVGNLIHGAIEDAAAIRAFPGRRGQVPTHASPDELLYLLELQKDAIRQDLNVIEGPELSMIVTTEVLARARTIVAGMQPLDLRNIYVDPRRGTCGVEYIWSFQASRGLLVAGIADMVTAKYDHRARPNDGPIEVTITDWKTGQGQLPSREELEMDAQAGLELCWARRAFPMAQRIRFCLYNVALQERVWIDWTPGLDQLMLSFASAAFNLWTQSREDAVVASHCGYCPYRGDCRDYSQFLREQGASVTAAGMSKGLAGKSMPELVQEYYRAKVLTDLADQRRKDASRLILAGLGAQKVYQTGNLVARKKNRRMPSYSDEAGLILELARESGTPVEAVINACCGIKKGQLDGWVKTMPVEKQAAVAKLIDLHQSLNETPHWIEVSEKEALI